VIKRLRSEVGDPKIAGLAHPQGIADPPTLAEQEPAIQPGSAQLAAADLFFFDLALSSEDDSDKTDPLATHAADELALMLIE